MKMSWGLSRAVELLLRGTFGRERRVRKDEAYELSILTKSRRSVGSHAVADVWQGPSKLLSSEERFSKLLDILLNV